MKTTLIRSLLIVATLVSSVAFAAEDAATSAKASKNSGLLKDFDTLGGNDVLLDKARELNPDQRISVVQDRIVQRRNRLELAPEFASVLGGDPYNHTNAMALNAYFHINPHWALGAKYEYDTNSVRPEGQALIDQAIANSDKALVPDIDYPKGQALALVNWFPFYGKLNLFDAGVVHFDVYAVGGGGQVFLSSGNAATYTAGGGVGFWFSQHLSTRAELRYQTYEAQHPRYSSSEKMNLTVASLQIGYLL
jgi:outer membrane immunogenic protein